MRRVHLLGLLAAWACGPTAPVMPIRVSLRAFVDTAFFNHSTPDSGTLTVTVGDSSLVVPPRELEASHCVVVDVMPATRVHYAVHFPSTADSLWADIVGFRDRHYANAWASVAGLPGGGNGVWMQLSYVSQTCGDTAGVAP
jgi:hypothetical protein